MIEKRIIENSGSFSNQVIRIMFLLFLFLVFLSIVSSVNAANFNVTNGNSTNIQSFINTQSTDSDIILSTGNYTNIVNLNISRSLTIRGNGQVNIRGASGILFNITASNVKIINLNISGFQTAVALNNGNSNIDITSNRITTTGNSIIFSTGASDVFRGIRLENNIIYGSNGVYRYGSPYTASRLEVSFINNN
ncbi:MAG: hypothetical protein FWE58_03680, partial [Methanobrevibacter sp.]|nr:hypothetical protein [Methanobrevibacter sp.]